MEKDKIVVLWRVKGKRMVLLSLDDKWANWTESQYGVYACGRSDNRDALHFFNALIN